MKKLIVLMMVTTLVMGTMALSFANTNPEPKQIFAGTSMCRLTGDSNVPEGFKGATTEEKIAYIQEALEAGELTQEEADAMIERISTCNGMMMRNTRLQKKLGRN